MRILIKLLCITFIGYIYSFFLTNDSLLSLLTPFIFGSVIILLKGENFWSSVLLVGLWYLGFSHNNSYIMPFLHHNTFVIKYLKFYFSNIFMNINYILLFVIYSYKYKNGNLNKLIFLLIVTIVDYFCISYISLPPSRMLGSLFEFFNITKVFGLFIVSIITHILIILFLDSFFYRRINKTFLIILLNLVIYNQILKNDLRTETKDLTISIIQGKSFKESQKSRYYYNEIIKMTESDLILLPESALSEYSLKSINEIQSSLKDGQMIISGYKNSSAIILTNRSKKIILKKIPFIVNEDSKYSQIQALYHRFIDGDVTQQCFSKDEINICLFICWETSFYTYISQFRNYDLAVNLSGDELLNNTTKTHNFKSNKAVSMLHKVPIIRSSQGGSSGLYDENSNLIFKTPENQHLTKTFKLTLKK